MTNPGPLRLWREGEGLSIDEVVARLAAHGRSTSAAYLRHIELGFRSPSYTFAKDLVAISGGKLSVEALKDYCRAGDDEDSPDIDPSDVKAAAEEPAA